MKYVRIFFALMFFAVSFVTGAENTKFYNFVGAIISASAACYLLMTLTHGFYPIEDAFSRFLMKIRNSSYWS